MTTQNKAHKRADKVVARLKTRPSDWEVEHYTLRCGECRTDGEYDEGGDVYCPDCGRVLSDPDLNTYANVRHEHRG